MAQAGDLRVLLGALAGVGLGGVALLTALPVMAPLEPPRQAPVAAPAPAAAAPADPALATAPRFDTVRLAPDGSGLVAGQAEPGASVAVLADDAVAAEVTADADGRFVAFLELSPSAEPRALSLRDGAGGLSEETVIVAPTGPASGGVDVAIAPEAPATGPGSATREAAGPASRDLPSDRPAPDLARADDLADGPSGAAGPGASEEAAPADLASDGEAPGEAPGPASPLVAVGGPVPTEAPDVLPDHGPAPLVEGAPGLLPGPEGGSPGQAAVLVSDAEGVRVLQPALSPGADAEVLATVALDAISYGGEGEVLLAGRASGGGVVRLYLDNVPVAEAQVGPDGAWSAALAGTEPGTYTLRVDQIDARGEVMSRIETPFLREARADLATLTAEAQEAGRTIAMRTVQPGNTLWAIARDRYGEPLMYVQVFEMNRDRIRDPDLIYPGQVFVLPATTGR